MEKQIEAQNGRKKTRVMGLLAFLIPFILCLVGLKMGGFRPFGNKDLFTAVGQESAVVRYYEFYDRVHSGNKTESFLLNTTVGLGEDYSGTMAFYLADPINLLVLLFPRAMMLTLLHLLFAVKLGLAGLFTYIYLRWRRQKLLAKQAEMDEIRKDAITRLAEKAAAKKQKKIEKLTAAGKKYKEDIILGGKSVPKGILGKILSAEGLTELAFAMIFPLSQFIFSTGTNITYASAFMLLPLIILGLDRLIEDGKWGFFAVTYMLSFFASFHGALMISVFLFFYFAFYSFRSLPNFLRSLKLVGLSVLLAVGTAAIVIIPAFGSSAADATLTTKFTQAYLSTGIFDNLKAFLAGTAPAQSLMYGHNLDVYCGVFTLLLILLFTLNPHIKASTRVRDSILLVILWSGTWLSTTNHLFNGFFYFNHFTVAYGFTLAFFAMRIAHTLFLNIDHTRAWHLHVSAAFLSVIAILSMMLCDRYDTMQPLTFSLEIILVYYILMLLYRSRSMAKYLFCTCFALLMLFEMGHLFPKNMKQLATYAIPIDKTAAYSDYDTVRLLHKDRPVSRVEIYNSNSSYATPVTEALMSYDYVIARRGTTINSGLTALGDISYSTLYQNKNAGGARFTTAKLDQYSYNKMYPFISSNILAETYLKGKPIFTETSGNAYPYASEVNVLYYIVPNEGGDLYALLNYISHLSENAQPYEEIEVSQLYPDFDYTNEYMQVYKFDQTALEEMLANFTAVDFPKFNRSMKTFVTTPEAGYLVIPVPKLTGLTVKVDGKEVKATSFMDEGSVIPVPGGEVKIEILFTPVFLIAGSIVSVVFLIALILLLAKGVFGKVTERETKVSRFLRANWVYFAAFGIPFFAILFMAAFTGCYPFGQRFLLNGDAFEQGYPSYVRYSNFLKNGTFFQSPTYGAGLPIDRTLSIYGSFIDPLGLLFRYILPSSLYQFAFTMDYILYFSLSGITITIYLTHRKQGKKMKKNDPRLLLFSLAYSLTACSIGFFIYYGFYFLVFFPLILLSLEALVYENKYRLYIFLLWYRMVFDAYYAFILCELIVCFFLIQNFKDIKHFIRSGIRLALTSILSAGMAALWILPYYFHTTNSSYVNADSTTPSLIGWFTSLRKVFGEFRLSSRATTNSDLSYKANLYCGMALLLFLPLYVLNKRLSIHVRIKHMALLVLLFLSFDNKLLNYVFHGFHLQTFTPNRYVFAFVILILIMTYDTVLNFDGFHPRTVFLSVLSAAIVYIFLAVPDSGKDFFYKLTIGFIIIQLIFAIFYLWKKNQKLYLRMVSLGLIAEILFAAVPCISSTVGHSSISLSYAADINQLAKNHPEMTEDLVMTEDIGTSNYNLGQMSDIHTLTAFSSWLTIDHLALLRKWNISCSANTVYYLSGSPLSDMLFRINYHTVNIYNESSESIYPLVDQVNNVELHENPYVLPLGIFFKPNDALKKWDEQDNYNDGAAAIHQNDFINTIGCKDIYNELPIVTSPSENSVKENYVRISNETYQGSLDYSMQLYKFYISEDVEGDIYLSVFNYILYIGKSEKGVHDTLELYLPKQEADSEKEIPDMHLLVADQEAIKELYKTLAAHTMTNVKLEKSVVTGDIDAPEDGMIFLSFPNLPGYHAYVDGKEVEISTFLGGIGIPVSAGQHHIKLDYKPEGLLPGTIISIISFLILIGWFVTARIMRKKKKAAGEPAAQNTDSAAEA